MTGRCPSSPATAPSITLEPWRKRMMSIWRRHVASGKNAWCAGLVKLLRRCLTQMSSRARAFIDTCIRFEREARQQASQRNAASPQHAMPDTRAHQPLHSCCFLDPMYPAEGSASQALGLSMHCHIRWSRWCWPGTQQQRITGGELAAAQRDAAQVEAQHKGAAASWHTELDWHRSEVCRRHRLCSAGACVLISYANSAEVCDVCCCASTAHEQHGMLSMVEQRTVSDGQVVVRLSGPCCAAAERDEAGA